MKRMAEIMAAANAELSASAFFRWMMKPKTAEPGHTEIRKRVVYEYTGLSAAAKLLGVSPTQIKRHVSGEQPSRRLARRMADAGVEVAV